MPPELNCGEKSHDLSVSEGLHDGREEVRPRLGGQKTDLDQDQCPHFRVCQCVLDGLLDRAVLIRLVVSSSRETPLGESPLLLRKSGLGATVWKVG